MVVRLFDLAACRVPQISSCISNRIATGAYSAAKPVTIPVFHFYRRHEATSSRRGINRRSDEEKATTTEPRNDTQQQRSNQHGRRKTAEVAEDAGEERPKNEDSRPRLASHAVCSIEKLSASAESCEGLRPRRPSPGCARGSTTEVVSVP